MTQQTKERRFEKAKKLFAKLKIQKRGNFLIFFSDEKNFQQDQKVNWKNDRLLCANADEVPIVMETKYPATIMVLGVVSNKSDITTPYFFKQGLRVNADAYLKVLQNVVVSWMK